MPDVATLVIAVNSKQADDAAKSLERLKKAGTEAETPTRKIGEESNRAAIHFGALEIGTGRATRELVSFIREASRGEIGMMAGTLASTAAHSGLLALALTPLGAIIGAVTLAAGIGVTALVNYQNAMQRLNDISLGAGRNLGLTGEQLKELADKAADAGNITQSSAEKMAAGYASSGKIGSENLGQLISITEEYARATGEKATQAQSDLNEVMNGNIPALEAMNSKFGFLTGTQLKYIEQLITEHRLEEAQKEILPLLSDRLNALAGGAFTLAEGWRQVHIWADKAFLSMGAAINRGGSTDLGSLLGYAMFPNTRPGGTSRGIDVSGAIAQSYKMLDDARKDIQTGIVAARGTTPDYATITGLTAQQSQVKAGLEAALRMHESKAVIEDLTHKYNALTDTIGRLNTAGATQYDRDVRLLQIDKELIVAKSHHNKADIERLTAEQTTIQLGSRVLTNTEALAIAHGKAGIAAAQDAAGHRQIPHVYREAEFALERLQAKLKNEQALWGLVGTALEATRRTNEQVLELEQKTINKKGDHYRVSEQLRASLYAQNLANIEGNEINRVAIAIWDRLNENVIRYTRTIAAIKQLASSGNITTAQAATETTIADITKQQADYNVSRSQQIFLNPLKETNEALDRQVSLYKYLGDEREIQQRLDEAKLLFVGKFIPNEAQLLKQYEQELRLAQQLDKQDKALADVIQGSLIEQEKRLVLQENALIAAHRLFIESNGRLGISIDELDLGMRQLAVSEARLRAQASGSWVDAYKAKLLELGFTGKTVAQQMGETFANATLQLSQGLGDAIAGAIVGTQNLGQALLDLARRVIAEVISQLIQMFIWEQLTHLIGGGLFSGGGSISTGGLGYSTADGLPYAKGGLIHGYPGGGLITGPGGPKDDKVLIWGSNGEYVVNAEATAKYKPFLEAINRGNLAANDNRHFASGGPIGGSQLAQGGGTHITFDFRGANLGGVDLDTVEKRFRNVVEKEYGPKFVASSVQQSVIANNKLTRRQTLNIRRTG